MNEPFDLESWLIFKLCHDVDSWLKVFRLLERYTPDSLNAHASSYSRHLILNITYFNGNNRARTAFEKLKTKLKRDINKVGNDLGITFSEELR